MLRNQTSNKNRFNVLDTNKKIQIPEKQVSKSTMYSYIYLILKKTKKYLIFIRIFFQNCTYVCLYIIHPTTYNSFDI